MRKPRSSTAATRSKTTSSALEYTRRHIKQLYQISKVLAGFESVERTVPAVLALATDTLHLRIAIIMEGLGGRQRRFAWRSRSVTQPELEEARAQARSSYEYLGGVAVDATPADLASAVELEAMTGAEKDGRERSWTLPLVVDRRTVFGVLYARCRDALDEIDLAFMSAVANQVAVALDRHYARKAEVTLRLHAEALAVSEHAAQALAHEAVGARDAFILVAAHELRGPLGALSMQVALLMRKEKRTDEEVQKRLNSAMRQLTRMTKLVDSLLDVSRVTAGRLDLELELVDLAKIVREAVDRAADDLKLSRCPLDLQAERPVVGRWDRLRLDQIVTNLLSNALKYGKGKPIGVVVELHDGTARLRVSDRGVGLSPEDQGRIFERFERAGVNKQAVSGLGLGLWIVRQIVVAMGGTIQVASQVGAGSTFTVELPVSRPAT